MMSVIYLDEWREKLESITNSRSQSKLSSASEETGQGPTDEELAPLVAIYMTLDRARQQPFTTKSDFARYAADVIGICASSGLISTQLGEETFGNRWLITEDGLVWMRGFDDTFARRH